MAFLQTLGIFPDSQTCSDMAVKYDCRWGQCLNTKTDIWCNRQGQPDDFILLITFVTSWYVGGLVFNEEDGGGGQIVVSNSVF